MATNTLRRNLIVAGTAAVIALSPLAAKNAFAAKTPIAERPVATVVADSSKGKKGEGQEPCPLGVPAAFAAAAVIGALILLAGTNPPQRNTHLPYRSPSDLDDRDVRWRD